MVITLVVLYGCEVWGSSISNHKWRKIERIQKHLIISNFKVKATVLYEILLAKDRMFPLEASRIICLLSYLKNVENMEAQRWPKLIYMEELKCRKKTWRKLNDKWMRKWGINWQDCPNAKEEIKNWVVEKFSTAMWEKQFGRKK